MAIEHIFGSRIVNIEVSYGNIFVNKKLILYHSGKKHSTRIPAMMANPTSISEPKTLINYCL